MCTHLPEGNSSRTGTLGGSVCCVGVLPFAAAAPSPAGFFFLLRFFFFFFFSPSPAAPETPEGCGCVCRWASKPAASSNQHGQQQSQQAVSGDADARLAGSNGMQTHALTRQQPGSAAAPPSVTLRPLHPPHHVQWLSQQQKQSGKKTHLHHLPPLLRLPPHSQHPLLLCCCCWLVLVLLLVRPPLPLLLHRFLPLSWPSVWRVSWLTCSAPAAPPAMSRQQQQHLLRLLGLYAAPPALQL